MVHKQTRPFIWDSPKLKSKQARWRLCTSREVIFHSDPRNIAASDLCKDYKNSDILIVNKLMICNFIARSVQFVIK